MMIRCNAWLLIFLWSACETGAKAPGTNNASASAVEATKTVVAKKQEPKQPKPLVEVAEIYFKKAIAAAKKKQDAQLAAIGKGDYDGFLAQMGKAKEQCSKLDEPLVAMLKNYKTAVDMDEKEKLFTKIKAKLTPKDKKTIPCVVASTYGLDEDKILTSGILALTDPNGDSDVYHVRPNAGWAFLLTPQITTAWPGKAESGMRVLDPTEGPWKVLMATSNIGPVRTYSRAWTLKKSLPVMEYMRARRSGGIYFLFATKEGKPLGWIPWQDCAFYHEDWVRKMKKSKDFFVKGLASALHGVHYNPGGRCDERGLCNNSIGIYDFLSLTKGLISGQEIGPIKKETIRLTRVRDAHVPRRWLTEDMGIQIYTKKDLEGTSPGRDQNLNFVNGLIQMTTSDPPGGLPNLGGMKKIPIEDLPDLKP